MSKTTLALLIVCVAVMAAGAQTVPSTVKAHLNQNYAGWKQARGSCGGAKWLLTADLNGDRRTDYVVRILTGPARRRELQLVAFINKSGRYTAHPFYHEQFRGEVTHSASSVLKKGTVVGLGSEGEGRSQRLKSDAVTQYICETDASMTFVYAGGALKKIADAPPGHR